MNNNIYTDDVLDMAKEVVTAEDIVNTEVAERLDSMSDTNMAIARIPISSAKAATTKINSYADKQLANKIMNNGTFKLNGTVFHVAPGYKYKTQDVISFVNWLLDGVGNANLVSDLLAVLGGSFVPKLRGLDAVAQRRGMNPQTARDTFLEKVFDENPKLVVINTDSASAPKWAENMKEGERLDTTK